MKTYFISGHLNISIREFEEHYLPRIKRAMDEGSSFVVGDARGLDYLAQEFMSINHYFLVVVYHMFEAPRNNCGGFRTVGGFLSDDERDAAMTVASDEDIAWVRPGLG
jgi:hypothetical protein